MNKTKLKIASYLLLIFVAGAVSGGLIIWKSAGQKGPKPPQHRGPEQMCDFILNKWKEKIDLTDEQITKIRPLLEDGMKEIHTVQEQSVQEVRKLMDKTDSRIAEELSPEQKTKFEQMQREFREKRGPGGPGHRGPPPPA